MGERMMKSKSQATDYEQSARALKTVAVIGAGLMGSAIARALAKTGHVVSVWNRSFEKAQALEKYGINACARPEDAVFSAELIIFSLKDFEATIKFLENPDVGQALRPTVDLVQLTTGTPKDGAEFSALQTAQGRNSLIGCIVAYPSEIGTNSGAVFFSGDQQIFDRHKTSFVSLAGFPSFIGTDPGAAAALDLALLSYIYAQSIGFFHGAALAQKAGLSIESYTAMICNILPSIGQALQGHQSRMLSGIHDTSQSALSVHGSAVKLIRRMSQDYGLDSGLPEYVSSLMERAEAQGKASLDLSVLYTLMEKSYE
jgi:3-hydroxyisobutyrate dehydrogenase-like beta-hydroxyacid dehydrogenase